MSFLTQLNARSIPIVEALIAKYFMKGCVFSFSLFAFSTSF
jgi:hypothetical protein